MKTPNLARLGDTIEADIRQPQRGVIRLHLRTIEACAAGNDLLMDKSSGWRLASEATRQEAPVCNSDATSLRSHASGIRHV